MTTPADLLRDRTCGALCLLARSSASRCTCKCEGAHHGLLLHVHLDGLLEARRAGLHMITDRDLIEGIA